MDPKNAKTGDRFWAMLHGPRQLDLMGCSGDDYILKLRPFEMIYLQPRTPAEGEEVMRCATVDTGDTQAIHQNRLHEFRDDAIHQAIKDIDTRISIFNSGRQHYEAMFQKLSDVEVLSDADPAKESDSPTEMQRLQGLMECIKKVRIIMKDGPGPHGGFVECENGDGAGINLGEWTQDGDLWILTLSKIVEAISK